MDYGAIVVGAGHNGLICAAYLAKAGIPTLLVEARSDVGGCASTVDALGARVNICNCDHAVFRTTPVIEELDLARHGLRYLDPEPAQVQASWDGEAAWPAFHEVDRTIDALELIHPEEADGYRRYCAAAIPVAELVLEMACEPPSPGGVLKRLAARRARGAATMLRWSRLTAADVLRSFFSREVVMGPAVTTGPAVWGLSPFTPHTGLGALTYAMKHAGRVGRPVGGSGAVPASILSAFIGAGGLGEPIVAGLALADTHMILSGALPAAILALVVDGILALVERLVTPAHRRVRFWKRRGATLDREVQTT